MIRYALKFIGLTDDPEPYVRSVPMPHEFDGGIGFTADLNEALKFDSATEAMLFIAGRAVRLVAQDVKFLGIGSLRAIVDGAYEVIGNYAIIEVAEDYQPILTDMGTV